MKFRNEIQQHKNQQKSTSTKNSLQTKPLKLPLYLLAITITIFSLCTFQAFAYIPVRNPNFDVRERGFPFHSPLECGMFKPDITTTKDCQTNLPLQLSLIISDKAFPDNSHAVSPMNSITCFKKDFTCAQEYNDLESLEKDLNLIIEFYNDKGAQLFDHFPYAINVESGKFAECVLGFKNEIPIFDKKLLALKILPTDFEELKEIMFNQGAILAAFQPDKSFSGSYDNGGIWHPDPSKDKLSYALARLVGWRTLGDKKYWIFGFTRSNTWGIRNYAMVDITEVTFKFYSLEFVERSK